MDLPRICDIWLSDNPDTSAYSGSSPMIAIAVADLPEPDSPTSATTSPAATSKFMPRTAFTRSVSVGKVTVRLVTDSRLTCGASAVGGHWDPARRADHRRRGWRTK